MHDRDNININELPTLFNLFNPWISHLWILCEQVFELETNKNRKVNQKDKKLQIRGSDTLLEGADFLSY